jgi:hypothetical protein
MGVDMEAAQYVSASRLSFVSGTIDIDLASRHAFSMGSAFRPKEMVKSRDPKRTCRKPYRIWLHCQDGPSFVTTTGLQSSASASFSILLKESNYKYLATSSVLI